MKLKLWIIGLCFLTVLNLAAVGAFLFHHDLPGKGDRNLRRPGLGHFMGDHRPLKPEDKEHLFGLVREFHEQTRELRDRAFELEDEVMEEMKREPVDRDAVDELLREISKVRLELSLKATDRMIKAKEFLSPDQQEMFFRAIVRGRPGGPGPPGERPRRRR